MERGITLKREEVDRVFVAGRDTWRLRIAASDEVLMPRHIFGHQRKVINATDGTAVDEFGFIASPFDTVIYPIDNPNLFQLPQFFRRDSVDILVNSQEQIDTIWSAVQDQVCRLVESLDRLDVLQSREEIRCPSLADIGPTTELSVSESISGSESMSESMSESLSIVLEGRVWVGDGAWDEPSHWEEPGVPADNWVTTVQNDFSSGVIRATVGNDSTVFSIHLEGIIGTMRLEIADGVTLTAPGGLYLGPNSVLAGLSGGSFVGNIDNQGGSLEP